VLSSEEPVSPTQLALLIAMIAVFVAALILVSASTRPRRTTAADSRPSLARACLAAPGD
jgi:hypothetical protein